MAELREYQTDLKQGVYAHFNKGVKSVMAQLPTGGGKSVIVSSIVSDANKKGRRVLLLVHRKELVEQLVKHLFNHGIYAGVIMADSPFRPSAMAQVASVQTIVRRLAKYRDSYDLIITDEAHHAKADSYLKIYEKYSSAKHLGVTATPVRSNNSGFDDLFQELVLGPTVKELISMGFLVAPRVFSNPLRFDLSKLKVTAGDFNEKELYGVMGRDSITANLVEMWKKHALGMRTCVFAVNVEHSKQITARYKAEGISAAHIDGETPKEQRDAILRAFSQGSITVLSNCNIISEGFDVPAIECVQLARPTKSLAMYLQQVGRGLRPMAGKEQAIVLDHADNVFAHGFPEDDRVWTLKPAKKKEPKLTEIQVRDTVTGRVYEPKDLPEEINDIELIEVDNSRWRRDAFARVVEKAHTVTPTAWSWAWREFLKVVKTPTSKEISDFQKVAGYKNGWVYHQKIQLGLIPAPDGYESRKEVSHAIV